MLELRWDFEVSWPEGAASAVETQALIERIERIPAHEPTSTGPAGALVVEECSANPTTPSAAVERWYRMGSWQIRAVLP